MAQAIINHEDLLRKFITYVRDCEGIDFVEDGYRGYPGDQIFTTAEWAELSRLSASVQNEAKRRRPGRSGPRETR